jgi:hypothetical protein
MKWDSRAPESSKSRVPRARDACIQCNRDVRMTEEESLKDNKPKEAEPAQRHHRWERYLKCQI